MKMGQLSWPSWVSSGLIRKAKSDQEKKCHGQTVYLTEAASATKFFFITLSPDQALQDVALVFVRNLV